MQGIVQSGQINYGDPLSGAQVTLYDATTGAALGSATSARSGPIMYAMAEVGCDVETPEPEPQGSWKTSRPTNHVRLRAHVPVHDVDPRRAQSPRHPPHVSGICHVHYPALTNVVIETAQEYGLGYRENKTVRGAFFAHLRWLKVLGTTDTVATGRENRGPAFADPRRLHAVAAGDRRYD